MAQTLKNFSDIDAPMMHALYPCPHCKNNDVDTLIWDDWENIDGPVTCMVCSTRYYPGHPECGFQLAS